MSIGLVGYRRFGRTLCDDFAIDLVNAQLTRRAAEVKARLGRGLFDPVREVASLRARPAWAITHGLDPASIVKIFEAVLRFSRGVPGFRGPRSSSGRSERW